MQTFPRRALPLAFIALFIFTVFSLAPADSRAAQSGLSNVQAVNCPSLLLKHWKASNQNEKLAFLFGFATMLEMEKEWQGSRPLAITSSINNSWVRGLAGVSLGEMASSIDRYAAEHPDKMKYSVMEVLGRIYVSPKLTEQERKMARKHYQRMQSSR